MNTTKERFEYLKSKLEAKFNVKNPIVEGVYQINSLRWINSPDGKQMIFYAGCNWKESGTRNFDTSHTVGICLNTLFSRVASKPNVLRIESEFFKIHPEDGSASFRTREVELNEKLTGVAIQVEKFEIIINRYNKPQPKLTWNFYVQRDTVSHNQTSEISNYRKPEKPDFLEQFLHDPHLIESLLIQQENDYLDYYQSIEQEDDDDVMDDIVQMMECPDDDYPDMEEDDSAELTDKI